MNLGHFDWFYFISTIRYNYIWVRASVKKKHSVCFIVRCIHHHFSKRLKIKSFFCFVFAHEIKPFWCNGDCLMRAAHGGSTTDMCHLFECVCVCVCALSAMFFSKCSFHLHLVSLVLFAFHHRGKWQSHWLDLILCVISYLYINMFSFVFQFFFLNFFFFFLILCVCVWFVCICVAFFVQNA